MPHDIEKVRQEWIGKEAGPFRGDYPVEYEPIRRLCHMVDDTNPLFLDPEYAKKTRYGEVICPPVLVDYFSRPGPWPRPEHPHSLIRQLSAPGRRLVNLNQEYEWFRPVKVGDHLSSIERVADIQPRPTRLDPEGVLLTTEYVVSNQRGEVVCILRNQMLLYRTRPELQAQGQGHSQ